MSRRGGVMDNRLHNKLLRISFFTQFDGERSGSKGRGGGAASWSSGRVEVGVGKKEQRRKKGLVVWASIYRLSHAKACGLT